METVMMMLHRRLLPCLIILSSLIVSCVCSSNAAAGSGGGGGGGGGRHSYSLSTFSPNGEIDQIVRSVKASMLGLPIVALATTPSKREYGGGCRGIYISLPLRSVASSPLIIDDGTPRIVQLTSTMCVVHTGVNADGRALCDVATAMALDYAYIYGMEITAEELLAGLSDKMQEMTMKAGSRPYGCALLVACLGNRNSNANVHDDDDDRPTMYRVDPNGAVVLLTPLVDDGGVEDSESAIKSLEDMDANNVVRGRSRRGSSSVTFLGNWGRNLYPKIDEIRSQVPNERYSNESEIKNLLLDIVKQTFFDDGESSWSTASKEISHQSKKKLLKQHPMLFASFTRDCGLRLSRIDG